MNDVFAKGRMIHRARQQANAAPPPMPGQAAGGAPPPTLGALKGSFPTMAKRFGADQLRLSPNPDLARAQLKQHLYSTLGQNFMQAPGVPDLFNAYESHLASQNKMKAKTPKGPGKLKGML